MTASEKSLRAAIVGCHGIGKTHAKAMKQATMVELVALCDLDEQIARELSHEYGLMFTSLCESSYHSTLQNCFMTKSV